MTAVTAAVTAAATAAARPARVPPPHKPPAAPLPSLQATHSQQLQPPVAVQKGWPWQSHGYSALAVGLLVDEAAKKGLPMTALRPSQVVLQALMQGLMGWSKLLVLVQVAAAMGRGPLVGPCRVGAGEATDLVTVAAVTAVTAVTAALV